LDLSYNEIGNKGALLLARMIKDDSFIENLNLKSNNIGPVGAEAIGKSLSYNSTISKFDISDNNLGEEGGMSIASALQVNTILRMLYISGCSIPTVALISIATILQSNNQIQHLDISNNLLRSNSLTQSLITNVMTHFSKTFELNYGLTYICLSKLGITDWIMCDFLSKSLGINQDLVTIDLSW
jgi:Ran GTPase-activating protein (RanGAP) involved in mRNA processing and transport